MQVHDLHFGYNWIQRPDGSYELPRGDVSQIELDLIPFQTREYIFLSDCGGSTGSGGWGA